MITGTSGITLKFDIPNANRIFVLDRCTDGSKELLESYNETYIERNDAVGFCAGSARNIGLKHTNPRETILSRCTQPACCKDESMSIYCTGLKHRKDS